MSRNGTTRLPHLSSSHDLVFSCTRKLGCVFRRSVRANGAEAHRGNEGNNLVRRGVDIVAFPTRSRSPVMAVHHSLSLSLSLFLSLSVSSTLPMTFDRPRSAGYRHRGLSRSKTLSRWSHHPIPEVDLASNFHAFQIESISRGVFR